jgi:hypothetical protein
MKWLTVFLAVSTVVLAIFWIGSLQEKRRLTSAIKSLTEEVSYWKDEHNRSNAQARTLELKLREIKQADPVTIQEVKDLGIRPRDFKDKVTINTITKDTIYLSRPQFDSKWTKVTGVGVDKIAVSYLDSITLVHHWQSGFLGRDKHLVVRAISYNPNTTLTGIQSISIPVRQRKFSFGAHIGYGLQFRANGVSTGWNIGVGLNYRIL